MDRISGSYPGGPKRELLKTEEERGFSNRIPRVDDFWRSAKRRFLRHKERVRRKRLMVVVGVTLIFSCIGGVYLGFQAHKSSEDLARMERERALRVKVDDPVGEADRLPNEPLKMEDLVQSGR